MFLTIEFPLADARPFLTDRGGAMALPDWPLPELDRDFIRGWGIVRKRKLGGLKGWVGESNVCDARRALRVPDFRWKLRDEMGRQQMKVNLRFRRFYADGEALAKYEIGFVIDDYALSETTPDVIGGILQKVLNTPTTIYVGTTKRKKTSLIKAGPRLAKSYWLCTSKKLPAKTETSKPTVYAGVPLVFLVHDEKERVQLPFGGTVVPYTKALGCTLLFHDIPFEGMHFRLWTMGRTDKTNEVGARELRICLHRLHAESECLRLILRHIKTGQLRIAKRSSPSELLQQYFVHVVPRLRGFAREADTISETDLAQLARESSELAGPGERDSLFVALRNLDMRPNVFHEVKRYIETQTIIMGDQVNISKSQGIALGGGIISGGTFQQWNDSADNRNLETLTAELETLRAKMKSEASTAEHDAAIGAVAEAQVEAKKGNGDGAFAYLAKAGKWALDIAKSIGVKVAADAIKHSLGMDQ